MAANKHSDEITLVLSREREALAKAEKRFAAERCP
jgi:hypothetical protein